MVRKEPAPQKAFKQMSQHVAVEQIEEKKQEPVQSQLKSQPK